MLTVEYIVDAVSPAYLDRIDLIQIKVLSSLLHMFYGQMPLILLIRDQILYRDLLEIYIRDVLIEIKFHFYWSFLSDSSIDAIA